jgi:transcriptional regulator with XRE-family HTH domain
MIKTDIQKEMKKLCIDEGTTLTEVAEKIDTSKQYMSRVLGKGTLVNAKLVEALEALGYDIEIKFVKRGEE